MYICKEISCKGLIKMYKIEKGVVIGRQRLVTFEDKLEISTQCACKKFEGEGILCRHILRLFFQMNIDVIPRKHVLFRWTINTWYTLSAILKIVNDFQASTISSYMVYSFRSAIYRILNSICISP